MESPPDSMRSIQSIKLEQDDFIITSENNRRETATPDPLDFRPDIPQTISSGHEIPLPNIFASPVKNAPIPPAAESPSTPRTKASTGEEYPLPSVNSPVKQEPLLAEIACSPNSPIASSSLSMPSLIPSPAKKQATTSLRVKALTSSNALKKVLQKDVIRCICGFELSDGFMVQCNKCSVWQHIDCFYANASTRPVAHRCHICVPRYVDYENAKQVQQSKLMARSRLSTLVFDSEVGMSAAGTSNVAPPSRPSKRKQSLTARSTPDPRLMHTPDIISITDNVDSAGSRHRRYKTAEKNRYTEDLYKKLLRYNGTTSEHIKRNLAAELSTKDCETIVTPQHHIVLVSSNVLSLYDTVIEYRGEMMLKEEYLEIRDPTRELNPYVLFYSGLSNLTVVVDATKYGNEARFVRRCCKPNCEVKHTFGENNRLHLIIWATQKIVAGKELTIPFDFDYKECNYNVYCPCSRKNCDVRRWTQSRMYNKSYSESGSCSVDDLVPLKRLKQSIKIEKTDHQMKKEDIEVKKESKDMYRSSSNGHFSSHSNVSNSSLLNDLKSSVKVKEESSTSKKLSSQSLSSLNKGLSTSGPVSAAVTRLRSDAEARASLTARLQERLSPSKQASNAVMKNAIPYSPEKFNISPSSVSSKSEHLNMHGRPLSPSLRMSPNKLLQQQQQQSRRNRRKQQFVALRNPFMEDGNRSSDEEPDTLTIWSIDGVKQRR